MLYSEAYEILKQDFEESVFDDNDVGQKLREAQQIALHLLKEAAEQQN